MRSGETLFGRRERYRFATSSGVGWLISSMFAASLVILGLKRGADWLTVYNAWLLGIAMQGMVTSSLLRLMNRQRSAYHDHVDALNQQVNALTRSLWATEQLLQMERQTYAQTVSRPPPAGEPPGD
jgi:hypothetical protein